MTLSLLREDRRLVPSYTSSQTDVWMFGNWASKQTNEVQAKLFLFCLYNTKGPMQYSARGPLAESTPNYIGLGFKIVATVC